MKTVLIPVDGSAAGLQVVKKVVAGGRGRVDRIHLLNVQPRLTRHASRYLPRQTRDGWREAKAREALEPARRLVEAAGIDCRTHLGVGHTAKVVAQTAEALGAGEIVVAAKRRGPLASLLANPLSARLLETASVPVRVIPVAPTPALERLAVPVGVGMALVAYAVAD